MGGISGSPPYTGPQYQDATVVTAAEVLQHEVQAPPGTIAYTVEPGDNAWTLSNGDLATFYRNNPQFDPNNPQGRSADLIHPNEVVFLPDPATQGPAATTDQAAQDLAEANGLSVSTDSQATYKDGRVQEATTALETAALAEMNAAAQTAVTAHNSTSYETQAAAIDAQRDAMIARFGDNPAAVAVAERVAAQAKTDLARQELATAQGLSASTDSQATNRDNQIAQAQEHLTAALQEEIRETAVYPPNANREDIGQAYVAAGNAIAERLEAAGAPAEVVQQARDVAAQMETDAHNEI